MAANLFNLLALALGTVGFTKPCSILVYMYEWKLTVY
jgi:hypothetical protein